MSNPRVIDNDKDEITVTLDGRELRGWPYKDGAERRAKMLAALEYVEGWREASDRLRSVIKAAMQRLNESGTGEMDVVETIHATHAILANET